VFLLFFASGKIRRLSLILSLGYKAWLYCSSPATIAGYVANDSIKPAELVPGINWRIFTVTKYAPGGVLNVDNIVSPPKYWPSAIISPLGVSNVV
jgi:hypothetical protein